MKPRFRAEWNVSSEELCSVLSAAVDCEMNITIKHRLASCITTSITWIYTLSSVRLPNAVYNAYCKEYIEDTHIKTVNDVAAKTHLKYLWANLFVRHDNLYDDEHTAHKHCVSSATQYYTHDISNANMFQARHADRLPIRLLTTWLRLSSFNVRTSCNLSQGAFTRSALAIQSTYHELLHGWTDRQTDGQTDGRTCNVNSQCGDCNACMHCRVTILTKNCKIHWHLFATPLPTIG